MKRKKLFINIKDKINLPKKGCHCPPHYIPHRFPFGEKITDEPCHIHKAKWRMQHHIFFCKKLKCPNFEKMIKFDKKMKNEKTS
jgi:hypothetical protein